MIIQSTLKVGDGSSFFHDLEQAVLVASLFTCLVAKTLSFKHHSNPALELKLPLLVLQSLGGACVSFGDCDHFMLGHRITEKHIFWCVWQLSLELGSIMLVA